MKIVAQLPRPDLFFSIATLNTWHGLSGQGKLSFSSYENRKERVARLRRQVAQLSALEADVIVLQEVNPLPFRAYWYASQLSKRCYFSAVNSGLKLGWGFPTNLSEGLAILCPRGWTSHFVGEKPLSGGFRFSPLRFSAVVNPFLSFQFHESRSAMAVRIQVPKNRQIGTFRGSSQILLCAAHLHHVPSMSGAVRGLLEDESANGLTNDEREIILERLQVAEARRVSELDVLVDWIETIRKPGEAVLLCGDFNAEPESAAVDVLARRGWVDAWTEGRGALGSHESATWDPQRNPLCSRGQMVHGMPKNLSERVAKFFLKADLLPRRIDYIFMQPWQSSFESGSEVGCFGRLLSVERFGCPSNKLEDEEEQALKNELLPADEFISDHYGLVARFGG